MIDINQPQNPNLTGTRCPLYNHPEANMAENESQWLVCKIPITILADFFMGGGQSALKWPGEAYFL